MRLAERVAIVTGAASGFGAGIARCLVAEGAKVVVADRDTEAGRQVVAELAQAGGQAVFCQVDVTQTGEVEAMVSCALSDFGALHILVNNAGLGQRPVALEDTTDAVFDQLAAVNMRSVFLGCRAALPHFRAQGGGTIINMASGAALTPRPKLVAYAAGKGWVVTFTKALAMELAEVGIRVNALCPAAGDTPMLAEFMGGTENVASRVRFTESIPMGRLTTPEDVGWAAVYLASDEAAMITGTALAVDGGRCI